AVKIIPPTGEYMSVHQAAAMLGCTARTIWKLAAAGKFPKPVRITPRLPRWKKTEIESHLASLADAR
ncbi:MAG: helix-turn-helix transcriptional regulator, partial [Phycisphaerae bacterium]